MRQYLVILYLLLLIPRAFSQALPELIPYRDGNKWGYADSNGKVVLEPQWRRVNFFENGKGVVFSDSGYASMIDPKGNVIIPLSLHWAFGARSAFNAHDSLGHYGYINQQGVTEVPLVYQQGSMLYRESSRAWKRSYVICKLNGKEGIIDSLNNIIIPFKYDQIFAKADYVANGKDSVAFCIVKLNDKFGVIDQYGNVRIPLVYEELLYLPHQTKLFFRIKQSGKYGVIDYPNGREVASAIYDDISFTSMDKHLSILTKSGKQGALDLDVCKIALPVAYVRVEQLTDTSFIAQMGSKYGIVNIDNKVVLPFEYGYICQQNNTIYALRKRRYRKYDKYALRPESQWLRIRNHMLFPPLDFSAPMGGCGGGTRMFTGGGPLALVLNGIEVYTFRKDSVDWHGISFYRTPTGRLLYCVGGEKRGRDLLAIVDSTGEFVFLPATTIHGSPGVQNIFCYEGRWHAIIKGDDAQGSRINVVLREDGKYVSMPDSVKLISIPDAEKGIMAVEDPQNNIGFILPDGTPMLKEISFKYKSVEFLKGNIFFVRDRKYQGGRFVNDRNEEIFPGKKISWYQSAEIPSLYLIGYYDKKGRISECYMDTKGRAYLSDFSW